MDWNSLLTLINGADTLLGVAILIVATRYWLRRPRRSEPRPVLKHLSFDGREHTYYDKERTYPNCPACPQPQSPPQSAPSSEVGAGKNGG